MIRITFIRRDGTPLVAEAIPGQTLLKIAQGAGIDLEGSCGGAMACSTCHLVIDSVWYAKLPSPGSDESDILDLAPNLTRTSRLGCQIKVTEDMDGLVVRVP